MIKLLLRTDEETKGPNLEEIVVVIEFHSGGKELFRSNGIKSVLDIFERHSNQ